MARIQLVETGIRRADEVILEMFDEAKLERPGGASGQGWSSMSDLMRCPRAYEYRFVNPPKVFRLDDDRPGVYSSRQMSLDLGGTFHQLRAMDLLRRMGKEFPWDNESFLDSMVNRGASAQMVMEARRLYHAYTHRWENDYLIPLAVEHKEVSKKSGFSCRYDLIAKVEAGSSDQAGPGIWDVELKTASREDFATTDGWMNDGEIIQQQMLWLENRLDKKFGRLEGVIVDIIVKTKEPKFLRVVVPLNKIQARNHERDLKTHRALKVLYEANGYFPRSRSGCITRWGPCEWFNVCAEGK